MACIRKLKLKTGCTMWCVDRAAARSRQADASLRCGTQNKVTGEAQWEKPAVLRKASFTKTPRKKLDHEIKKAADLSDDEAARMIQAMARAHAARRLMRNIARGVYQKVETDDGVYYVVSPAAGIVRQ